MIKSINIRFTVLRIAALCGLLAALMTSCVAVETHLVEDEGDTKTVVFTVRTPYTAPATYAMTDGAENDIQNIDVLAFSYNTSTLQEEFAYRAEGYNIVNVSAAVPYEKQFKVILNKSISSTDQYRLVFLANAKAELDAMTLVAGTEKEQLLSNILKSVPNAWNVASGSYTPFPMWGECQQLVVIDGTQSSLTALTGSKINLLRSVVSIEVDGSYVTTDYTLEDVYLYNRYTTGRVAPKGSFYVHGGYIGENGVTGTGYVTKPSLPASPNVVLGPLHFTVPPFPAVDAYKSERTIYTFETDSTVNGDDFNATAIVVGGTYMPTGVKQYYRIDFDHRNSVTSVFESYRPLLRNHRYRIVLNTVTADGHNTPDSAFYGKKGKLDAKVIDWNLGDSSTITVSETHVLAVTQTSLLRSHFANDLEGAFIGVTSNHPDGWTVEVEDSVNNSWLTVDNPVPYRHYDDYLHCYMYYTSSNMPPASPNYRTGYLIVRAGNLSKKIKVMESRPF